MINNYKEIFKKLLKDKKLAGIFIILFAGMTFVLLSQSFETETKEKISENNEYTYESVVLSTEEKLKKLLLSIDGVDKVEIMVCFSDMGIKEYYKDETEDYNENKTKTDKKIVFKRYEGNEIPVLKREVYPEIKGVTVIADCSSKNTYDLIFKAVKTSLGADSHKIEIIINDRSKK